MMKNKGKILACCMTLVLTLTLSACGSSSNNKENGTKSSDQQKLDTSKVQDIKKKGKIVLGTCADYPPYEFHLMNDGKDQIVGFDIEIGKAIANKLGVELQIKDMDFKGLIPSLKTGNVDFVISGMTPTEERKKDVGFSKVYYKAIQSIIIKKQNVSKYKSIEDLKATTIGVQKTSLQESIAKEKIPTAKLKSLGKITDLMLSLKNDKVQAIIVEGPVAKAYVSKNQDLAIADIIIGDQNGGSAIAVNKGNDELVKTMNDVLEELNKGNKIDNMVTKASEMVEK